MLLPLIGYTQQPVLKFTNISTEQGLSENTVLDILQDPYGFMWFATENGLTKFDGMNYTVFRDDDLDSSSLVNDLQSLCIKGDELFIASVYPTTVSAFNLKTEKFRVLLSCEQIDDVEKAYFLENYNFTLLVTNREKYIYNEQKKQFEVYEALNSVLDGMKATSNTENTMSTELPPQAEHYFLDNNDNLVGFKSESGIFEISLPDLSHRCLFSYNEFRDLYKLDTYEEFTEVFLYRDSEKRIWFNMSNNQLGFFHHISGTFHLKLEDVLIKDIFEDADNNLWFASESGVYFYDSKRNLINHFTHNPAKKYSLSNNFISSIFMNDHEILWVGHDGGGVDHARYYSIKNFQHLDTGSENSLISDRITGISESIERDIWIGTDRGLNRWDIKREEITSYLEEEFIKSVFCDSRGNVWCIYGENHILLKRPGNIRFENVDFTQSFVDTPLLFFEDSKKRLWLIGQGLFLVDYKAMKLIKNKGCSEIHSACSVIEDKNGNFWITENTGHLIIINPDLMICHQYSSDINDPLSLNSNILWDVHIDKQDNLWIATNRGLNRTNISSYSIGDELHFESYTLKDGLNDEIVFRIIEDEQENLWFATNNGLSKMIKNPESSYVGSKQSRKFINYFTLDGIASNSIGCYTNNHITYLCGIKLANGKILLGSSNGITSFNPDNFTGNRHSPPVFITDLKIFNRSVPIGSYQNRNILSQSIYLLDDIELSYKDKVFSLDFIALDYADPRKNQYKYMLEGFDDDWIFLENRRVASFTNIPGGDYILKIKAANNEGYWNPYETSIGISITPPFWQTWWFRFLGIVIILGSFILFYHLRTNQMHKQKLKLKNQVKERTNEIEEKNNQLENQAIRLNEINFTLEEKTKELGEQSEELQVKNEKLIKQKSELEDLNKEIKMANKAKLEFFTNISHELRTPLSLISGPIDSILSNRNVSGDAREQLYMMQRNTNRLLRLINQLIDFRKLETEHMRLSVSKGNIIQYLKEIYMLFSNLANQKNIDYSFDSEIDELSIWYDPDKIEKIVSNLLSNAFKYTTEGGRIVMSLGLVNDTIKSESEFQITIADSGIGISENKIKHIFKRYYCTVNSNNMELPGTGIGLEVTKNLVELHKGRIFVKSKVATEEDALSGSEFIIQLPLSKRYFAEDDIHIGSAMTNKPSVVVEDELLEHSTFDDNMMDIASESAEKEQQPEILIVEDNLDMTDFLISILIKGFRIQSAANGIRALEIMEEKSFSLIISDVMMPEMDGIEFCRQVKENINTSHIPVILLTAKTDIESQMSGLKTGADDYITKPFNSWILIQKINNLILSRERLWERFDKQIIFNPQELTPNSLDLKILTSAKDVVERNLSNPDLNVSLFAQEVGMCKSNLYEKLKSLTGKTINEFISSIRLKKAAELILSGELNLAEISMIVGYQDPNYFSKSFKKFFGVVPSKFNDESSLVLKSMNL